MKLGIFSDIHVHNWPMFATPSALLQGVNSRAEAVLDVIYQIKTIAVDQKIDALLFCGDFFEPRARLEVPLLRLFQIVMIDLLDVLPIYAISGNHDFASKHGNSVSALDLFEPLPANHPFTLLKNEIVGIGEDINLIGIEHGGTFYDIDPQDLEEQQDFAANGGKTIALMHTTFVGTKLGTRHSARQGEDLDGLKDTMKALGVKYCFVGDVHIRQNLGGGVWYVGSPIQCEFGEDSDKGMFILDTETWKLDKIKLDTPQFVTVELDDEFEYNERDYFQVKTVDEAEYIKMKTEFSNAPNVRVIQPSNVEKKERSQITLTMTHEEAFVEWLNTQQSISQEDRQILESAGKAILGNLS